MTYLLPSTVQVFGGFTSFLVGAFYLALSKIHRPEKTTKTFVLLAVAFGCQGLRHTCLLLAIHGVPFFEKASDFLYIGWVFTACLGILAYGRRRAFHPALGIAGALLVAWHLAALGVHIPMPWFAMPGHLTGAAMWSLAGIYLWRLNRERPGRILAILPIIILLYAFNGALYPFTRYTWYGPYGFTIAPFLALAIGMGLMLTALLEEQQELSNEVNVRKRAEGALQESEERFRGIANNLPGIVFQFYARDNGERGISFVDQRSEDIYGVKTDPLEDWYKRFEACIAPEDRERWLRSTEEAVRTASPWEFEWRFIKPTGEEMYVRALCQPRRLKNEVVWNGILLDVTDRRRADEALRESETRFRTLADATWEGVIIHRGGLIVEANRAFADMVGYDLREVVGMNILDLYTPESRERALRKVEEAGDETVFFYLEATRRDGTIFPIEVMGRPIMYDSQPARVVAIRDLTDRKRIESALLFTQAVLDRMTGAVFWVLSGGRIVYVNEAACTLLGYTKDELLALRVADIRPEVSDFPWEDQWREIKENKSLTFEDRQKKKTGEFCPVEIRADFFEFKGEEYACGIVHDITERKAAEAERERLILELQEALHKVKTLSGMLPICSSCKKVRNDKGYWEQIEVYVRDHSEAEFSHGICPECAERLYPEYFRKEAKEVQEEKRRFPRKSISVPGLLSLDNETSVGVVLNISLGGLLISVPSGSQLETKEGRETSPASVAFFLSGIKSALTVQCVVKHIVHADGYAKVGVAFTDTVFADYETLQGYLAD